MPVNVGAVRVPQFGGRVMAVNATAGSAIDSGVQFLDANGYPRFAFQLLGTFTGMSATFFGTFDPALYAFYLANIGTWQGQALGAGGGGILVPPATSWFQLPAPSEQGGAGTVSNPLTTAGTVLEIRVPVMAVRVVITAAAATGTCTAVGVAYA